MWEGDIEEDGRTEGYGCVDRDLFRDSMGWKLVWFERARRTYIVSVETVFDGREARVSLTRIGTSSEEGQSRDDRNEHDEWSVRQRTVVEVLRGDVREKGC